MSPPPQWRNHDTRLLSGIWHSRSHVPRNARLYAALRKGTATLVETAGDTAMVESRSMEQGPAEHGRLSARPHPRHRVESRFWPAAGRVSYQVLILVRAPPTQRGVSLSENRALRLARLYFHSVSSLTAGLLKETQKGESWELSLAVLPSLVLLRAGPQESRRRRAWTRTTYPMVGGILARGDDAGWFTFEVVGRGPSTTLSVRLDRFAPSLLGDGSSRIRLAFYRYTQSWVHRFLLKRFLRRAAATGV